MRTINLSDRELQFVVELLQIEIPHLREEILHTHAYEYRQALKEKEYFIKELVQSLKAQIEVATGGRSLAETAAASA
jgi:hypothetical protein